MLLFRRASLQWLCLYTHTMLLYSPCCISRNLYKSKCGSNPFGKKSDFVFPVHTGYPKNGISAACLNITILHVNTDYVGHERMTYPQLSQIYFSDKILKWGNGYNQAQAQKHGAPIKVSISYILFFLCLRGQAFSLLFSSECRLSSLLCCCLCQRPCGSFTCTAGKCSLVRDGIMELQPK